MPASKQADRCWSGIAWPAPRQPDPSAGLPVICTKAVCKKAAADISKAAQRCIAKSADSNSDLDHSGLFDRDLLFARLCLRRLWQRDGEHAVLETCLDLVRVDAVRDSERTLERAIAALGEG